MEREEGNRIVNPADQSEDFFDSSLRPNNLDEYLGQSKVKEKIGIFIKAAKKRREALDHVLLCGPSGLGKTTLAHIVANELGVGFHSTSGPVVERTGDIAAILTNLGEKDVLFIDEIHRLKRVIEEYLYSAMENFYIDLMVGEGPTAKSMKINLSRFTLIGATTRTGLLTSPLRSRFGVDLRLDYYSVDELKQIILRSARLLNVRIKDEGADELSLRVRGTPRIANKLLKQVRDYAEVKADGVVSGEFAKAALKQLGVDAKGLDNLDRTILETIITKFNGGPVGIDTIAAAVSEDKDTIEDVYEPFLIREGLLEKTPRGRKVTHLAFKHLNVKTPEGQKGLFS